MNNQKTTTFCTFLIYNINTHFMNFFLENSKEFKLIKSSFIKNSYFLTISCFLLKTKYLNIFANNESFNILFVIYDNTLFTKVSFFKYLTNKNLPIQTKNCLYLNFYTHLYQYNFLKVMIILKKLLLLK